MYQAVALLLRPTSITGLGKGHDIRELSCQDVACDHEAVFGYEWSLAPLTVTRPSVRAKCQYTYSLGTEVV